MRTIKYYTKDAPKVITLEENVHAIFIGGAEDCVVFADITNKITVLHASITVHTTGAKISVRQDGCLVVHGQPKYLPTIECRNNAHVTCWDGTSVTLYDNAQAELHDHSTACAYDSSHVLAYDKSKVTTYNTSVVNASDSTIITAQDHSTVYASQNVIVLRRHKTATVHASVILTDSDTVPIYRWCRDHGVHITKKNKAILWPTNRGDNTYAANPLVVGLFHDQYEKIPLSSLYIAQGDIYVY